MKKIIYTGRVEIVSGYNERRDCADQNIARFIRACGYLPIPIPNNPSLVGEYMTLLRPDGIILTGGNDLSSYGGTAPERDETEKLLVETSLSENLPLLGFCRGMQFIADYIGAKLVNVTDHAGVRHNIRGEINREVNSYHNFGITELPKDAQALTFSDDGVVEAMQYRSLTGIMWHPERENPFCGDDIQFFNEKFC